jgi:hypothetical protein
MGTTLPDQNCIHEEINSRLNSGNACYHSVQSLLSSRLLSRNVKAKIYKTIILPVVLHGCETWSLTLREEHRLRVFENRVLRRIFGPKRNEVTGECRKLHNEKLRKLYSSPYILRQINSRRMRLVGYVARMGKVYKVWWESPKERDYSEDQVVGGRMESEWILGILAWGVWIRYDWLTIGTGGGLF